MSSSTNINSTFFQGSYKHAWRSLNPPGLAEAEVDFIVEIGGLVRDSRVLDFMCGYGRHALSLGRRGFEVTAIDNLKDYIEEITSIAKEENLPLKAVQADALNMNLEGSYKAAICMGNSFAFFNKADAISILKKVSEHLEKDGILIINSWMVAEIAIKHFKERDWHYAGDYKCLLEYHYQFHPSRIESEQTIIAPDGSVEIINGIDYIFTLDELETMFNEVGLKTKALFSTPRKRRFSVGDGQIYIVAAKQ